jgi:hypothetical protein
VPIRNDRFPDHLSALMPASHLKLEDADPDQTLEATYQSWIEANGIWSELDDWLAAAAGRGACVDTLVGFLRTQSETFQCSQGLVLVRSKRLQALSAHDNHVATSRMDPLRSTAAWIRGICSCSVLVDGPAAADVAEARQLHRDLDQTVP